MFRNLCFIIALAVPVSAAARQGAVGEPGSVRWFDLLTEDAAAASAFYGNLFGWEMQRIESGRYVATHDGELIAGISQIERTLPEITEATWLVGVVVVDLHASVAAARRLGGHILRDVTAGRGFANWAVIEDPHGGQLLLLDPVRLRSLSVEPGPGHLVWTELWTIDIAAASRFYSEVVGWERGDREHPDGEYPLFQSAGEPRAGLVPIETEEIETGWAPYIGVIDLQATLARARELGGQVLLDPSPEIYDGLVAAVADPTGVAFLIYQFPEEAQ
jgi:predicted enzyme related to lactoylglutathione lyase